jgi:hypothetical protein
LSERKASQHQIDNHFHHHLEKINVDGHILFDDLVVVDRLRDYLKSSLLLNNLNPIEIEPINRDFSIKNKYIYMSMLNKSMYATMPTTLTTKNENENEIDNENDDDVLSVNQLNSSIVLSNPLGNYIESHSFVILESILALDKLQQYQTTNNTSTTIPQLPVIAPPNKSTPKNEFHRDSLLMFCLNFGSSTGGSGTSGASFKFKFSNFLMRIKLVFTELDVLKEDIKKCLDEFLNAHVLKRLVSEEANSATITTTNTTTLTCNDDNEENNKLQIEEDETEDKNADNNKNANIALSDYVFEANIDRVCYLKKPSNCKTIRLEQIKSSTDCFRAMVEFSRRSELNERPLIFVTCHANVSLNKRV